ncbi:MAG: cation:proton antiporter [Chloroflexi bacterium]|nr:cation:proton antiporter [Chloroflexota bacterium]
MPQSEPFIGFFVLLAAALVGGMIAHRLRQPMILGYLVIGAAVGPHALGLVRDLSLIEFSATVGVALLMLTLGLEFSISQFRQVGKVGLWGGISQIVATGVLGFLAGVTLFRWTASQSVMFGLIISLSSTAVCLKVLMERGEMDSVHGRIMMSILILQDISVVVMTIVTPLLGGPIDNLALALATAVAEAVIFVGAAIALGLWVLPWLMGRIGGVRSRELFLLTVLVMSLGAALATQVFGLSAVFGAFVVGLVLRETRFGHQALAEVTPLRDIFATLFFVSLGMLLSPAFLLENWAWVLVIVVFIILLKVVVVFGVIRSFGYNGRVAYLVGAGIFQVGEFGFILAQGGMNSGMVSEQFYSFIIASAIITMLLTPISINLTARLLPNMAKVSDVMTRQEPASGGDKHHPTNLVARFLSNVSHRVSDVRTRQEPASPGQEHHVIIAGYGRIGQNIAQELQAAGVPYLVIDIDPERCADARENNIPCIYGDVSNPNVLLKADLDRATVLVVVFPDPMAMVAAVRTALEINPKLKVVARVHREQEADVLNKLENVELISPEYEASLEFSRRILKVSGWRDSEISKAQATAEKEQKVVEFSPLEEL